MNERTKYMLIPGVMNAYELGVYHLGSPHTSIGPLKRRIDRADYGRKLAEAEGGRFTPKGYLVPLDPIPNCSQKLLDKCVLL
jgi:hypothetical protein